MPERLDADNAATSFPKPPGVLDAMRDYAERLGASAGRGAFPGHKGLLGPLGTAGLYLRPGVERRVRTQRQGGTGSVSETPTLPDFMPDCYESDSQNAIGLAGLSILTRTNQGNAATMFVPLQSFDARAGHREQTAQAIADRLTAEYAHIKEGVALVIPPPPVRGIGNAGGFKLQVEDRTGRATPRELEAATQKLIAAAHKHPALRSLFTTYRATVPQLYADVDRAKAQDVRMTDVFDALQIYLGSLYVNDFNYLGRTYRVTAQADAPFRANAASIAQLKTRNRAGDMVPLGAVLNLNDITGPDRLNRYNLYLSAEINGDTAPGASSGQAIAAMEALARTTLPPGYEADWTELAYQESLAGNTALFIFPLCVLFVWLVHSAEYESFALSTAIILIVPMCLLAGIAGVWLRGMDNNIFTQIGFVVLARLSAKNAVLIVEFAKEQQEHGLRSVEAATEAARLRLRPILMTSFAFILGVVPLILVKGAGAEMRQAQGTVVFFGMLGVTFFGLFFTLVFFTVIRRVTGRDVLPPDAHAAA